MAAQTPRDEARNAGKTDPGKPGAPRMTDAQRAYEARRAAKAGMTLEKWLAAKERDREEERRAAQEGAARRAAEVTPPKKPGFLRRLLDRAHLPLKGSR
ncbi:hypothetical protein [Muricoccus pecuniae]|uniref:Uncharacterized protein n=1 Tax=Muricoccus pecuniae TaxID=693023 RepID=A0A840YJH7_9PROT|nr:hypothetical protein [Roseomonas pecuniae]MBB5694872.1 hypothetical protein [Roseomonas pecuniae]